MKIKTFAEHRRKLKRYLDIFDSEKHEKEKRTLEKELKDFSDEKFSSLKTKVTD